MQFEDNLFFVERQVVNGPDDFEWEKYDSFYSEKKAFQVANIINVLGWTVRVTHGSKTLHELVGV